MDSLSFLLGITTSLAATFLIFIYKVWFWPWYLKKRHTGKNISGEWIGFYGLSNEPALKLILRQEGHSIIGESSVSKDSQGENVDRKYSYQGSFLDKSLVLTFDDINNSRHLGGAMVFFLANSDGTLMKGTTMYYKPELNEVVKLDAELWLKGHVPANNSLNPTALTRGQLA